MMFSMRRPSTVWLLLGLVLMFSHSVAVNAQPAASHTSRRNTFTSPDGAFRFEYPASLVWCERSPHQSDGWVQESCAGFTPVCSAVSCQATATVACVAYPAGRIGEGTNFDAAAFSANELEGKTTEAECLKVTEPPPQVGTSRTQTVNGVRFNVTHVDGVATGNLLDGYVYRAFHRNKCYELDIRIAYSNAAYADPGVMKQFDYETVRRSLKQVLNTFKFLK